MSTKRGASIRLDPVAEAVVRGLASSRGIGTSAATCWLVKHAYANLREIERRRVERLGAEAVANG